MPLSPGDPAPAVGATDQREAAVEPDFEAPTVLFFYPRDGSPGCETEARQFEAERESYAEAGVELYGVSTDDVASHAAFADDCGLGFPLLADPDVGLAAAFDVPVENGRAERTTFVLADGEVERVYERVRPDGHARTVLADLLDDGLVELGW